MNAEEIVWLVGSPTDAYTRVCYRAPSGADPLTPDLIRERYAAEVGDSALVVWRFPSGSLGGVRAGIDEVTWREADLAYFEMHFGRPGKGAGYIYLVARCHDGRRIDILSSDRYESDIHEWYRTAISLLERIYPGLVRTCDEGYDI